MTEQWNRPFLERIEQNICLLRDKGYDPYAQLYGYLKTGDDIYITRKGNARELVKTLDKDELRRYLYQIDHGK